MNNQKVDHCQSKIDGTAEHRYDSHTNVKLISNKSHGQRYIGLKLLQSTHESVRSQGHVDSGYCNDREENNASLSNDKSGNNSSRKFFDSKIRTGEKTSTSI